MNVLHSQQRRGFLELGVGILAFSAIAGIAWPVNRESLIAVLSGSFLAGQAFFWSIFLLGSGVARLHCVSVVQRQSSTDTAQPSLS